MREIYLVATDSQKPIGVAYATAYPDRHWCFVSGLVVDQGRAFIDGKLVVRQLGLRLIEELLRDDPDAEAIFFEVESRYAKSDPDQWLQLLESESDARTFWDVLYAQPDLETERPSKNRERPMSLMAIWPSAGPFIPRPVMREVLRWIWLDVYADSPDDTGYDEYLLEMLDRRSKFLPEAISFDRMPRTKPTLKSS